MCLYRFLYLVLNKRQSVSLLLVFLLHASVLCAQSVNIDDVTYGFKQDTISTAVGETFSNAFWIQNNAVKDVHLSLAPHTNDKKPGILTLPDTILLKPGQKKYLPLKYLADRQTIHKEIQDMVVMLRAIDQQVRVQESATFYVLVKNSQTLILDTDQQEVYLDQLTNQANVMVRCFNNGLIPVSFRIELTEIPEGLEFIGETMNLTLNPGEQQSLPFIAKNKLNRKTQADFAVTMRALDASGRQISVKRLRIMSVSSDRRLFLNQTPFYQNVPNTAALRYMNVDKSLSVYQLQGNGKYVLDSVQKLSYQVNVDYFQNKQQGVNVYDSYIDYQNNEWGVKVGNIYESLDFNLNGRGIKTTAHLTNKRSLNVYGVDNNFLLFSQLNEQKLGSTFAVNYKEENSAVDLKNIVLLHNTNLLTHINTTLLSANTMMPLKANQTIGLEGGYSVQDADERTPVNGAAFGINYHTKREYFNFFSRNYYATPYYGGIRRGLLQLDNKILYAINQYGTFSARFTWTKNRPKLMQMADNNPFLANNYGNAVYELGYSTRRGGWALNVMPYYFTQYMDVQELGVEKDAWHSSSIRTKLSANFSNAYHDFSVDMDNGYTFQNTSHKPPAPFLSSRINANYRNQIAGITAFVQLNSYYLSDALAVSDNPKYSIYSIGPNTQFALLAENITVNAYAMYNYFGYNRTHNYSFNSNIRWLLKDNWAISADIFYGLSKRTVNEYNPAVGYITQEQIEPSAYNFSYSNRQMRLGVEKRFGSDRNSEEKKLELVYFEDRNGNGYRDKEEPLVSGILVKIDGVAALTNDKGAVIFSAVKNKNYVVSVVNNRGWSTIEQTEVFLDSHKKMEIPLVKTARLTGELVASNDKYASAMAQMAGIKIHAVAESGKVFSTVTNEKGRFNFYLPENNYMVYVDTEGMPFTIVNPKENVDVTGKKLAELHFRYKDASRNVEVTKF